MEGRRPGGGSRCHSSRRRRLPGSSALLEAVTDGCQGGPASEAPLPAGQFYRQAGTPCGQRGYPGLAFLTDAELRLPLWRCPSGAPRKGLLGLQERLAGLVIELGLVWAQCVWVSAQAPSVLLQELLLLCPPEAWIGEEGAFARGACLSLWGQASMQEGQGSGLVCWDSRPKSRGSESFSP